MNEQGEGLRALVAFINERHGAAFAPFERLRGGYQEGAVLLQEPGGRAAVLKTAYAPRCLAVLARLRAVGYPVGEVYAAGAGPDGTPYFVAAYLPGEARESLDEADIAPLVALNRLQADLNPDPADRAQSWSDYARRVVFEDESGFASALHAHSPETAALLRRVERAAEPCRDIRLPNTDAVHGDFCPGNILRENGGITGVIDAAYAGWGTRAIDLATLLHDLYSEPDAPASWREPFRREILAIGGEPLLRLLLLHRVLATVEFSIRRHGEEGVRVGLRAGRAVLDELERPA